MHLHDERHLCYILESKGQQVVANQIVELSVRFQMEFKDEYLNITSKEFQNVQNIILQNVSMSVHNCYSKWFFWVFSYQPAPVLFNMHHSHMTVFVTIYAQAIYFLLVNVKKSFLKIKTPEVCSK